MTEPDNFILRWARLKRESESGREADVAANSSPAGPTRAVLDGAEATAGQPPIDAAAEEPFDLASLPSIEAITANTDVRGFLQSRVPLELTRAALRQAWASDPAIRDFIGIAENQWDFNDPTAIPGFGPIPELARAPGGRDKLADMIPEIPAPLENAQPAVADRELSNPDQSLQRTSERSSAADETSNLPDNSNESTATRNDGVAEENDSSRSYRSHGSALPR